MYIAGVIIGVGSAVSTSNQAAIARQTATLSAEIESLRVEIIKLQPPPPPFRQRTDEEYHQLSIQHDQIQASWARRQRNLKRSQRRYKQRERERQRRTNIRIFRILMFGLFVALPLFLIAISR